MRDLYKLINSYYTKIEYEYDDLNKLVKDAITHQVYPYLYPVLKNKELKRYTINAIQNASKFEELKSFLLKTLNDNNIDFIFLKGINLAKYYPESYLRTMGDIDLLVNTSDYLKAINLFKSFGLNALEETHCEHHIGFKYKDIEFELHQSLFDTSDNRYIYFKDAFNHKKNHEFELEYEIVYELCHMEKHIYHGGAGLRHLIDFNLLLKESYNKELLNQYLVDLKLDEFFLNIKKLSLYILDFNIELSKIEEELLEFLYDSGCHGKGSQTQLFALASSKKQSKFKYLFKKAFPSYKAMKALYPKLEHNVLLLPFYRIKRVCYMLKKRKKAQKVMSYNKEEIENVSKFLKGIGLNK